MGKSRSPFHKYFSSFQESSGLTKKQIFGLSSVGVVQCRRILEGSEPSASDLIHLCLMISEVERRPVQIILYEVLRVYVPRTQ